MTLEELEDREGELISRYNASEDDSESERLLEEIALVQFLMMAADG